VIAPVPVLSAMPAGQVPDWAMVALPAGPSVALAPLTVSLAITLAMGVDAVPAIAVPLSGSALM
jgi:hypothetical protein